MSLLLSNGLIIQHTHTHTHILKNSTKNHGGIGSRSQQSSGTGLRCRVVFMSESRSHCKEWVTCGRCNGEWVPTLDAEWMAITMDIASVWLCLGEWLNRRDVELEWVTMTLWQRGKDESKCDREGETKVSMTERERVLFPVFVKCQSTFTKLGLLIKVV